MPKLRGYICDCGTSFEFMHMSDEEPAPCPTCARVATERDEQLGGQPFGTIVPMYKGSLKQKAGYVHNYKNVPAEKISVQVPALKKG